MTTITSKANSLIKQTKKLQQKKHRKSSYLIEGWHLVEEAQKSGASFKHVFVTTDAAERAKGLSPLVLVSDSVLAELAQSPSPQGIVAELAFEQTADLDLTKGRYLFLEDVQDPGNVGTLIRTADAAGFDGVFVSDKTADIYNAKTLRSMQGSHFHLPVVVVKKADLLAQAKTHKLPILASTLSQTSRPYQELGEQMDFLLVMGNEGQGISDQTADLADILVHIPMPGQAESLNVAVAGGILMFGLI